MKHSWADLESGVVFLFLLIESEQHLIHLARLNVDIDPFVWIYGFRTKKKTTAAPIALCKSRLCRVNLFLPTYKFHRREWVGDWCSLCVFSDDGRTTKKKVQSGFDGCDMTRNRRTKKNLSTTVIEPRNMPNIVRIFLHVRLHNQPTMWTLKLSVELSMSIVHRVLYGFASARLWHWII